MANQLTKKQKGAKQETVHHHQGPRSEDVGDYSTRIDVTEYAGTDNRVAINIRYLSDLDRQIKDDIIVMEITNQGSPVAFRSNKDSLTYMSSCRCQLNGRKPLKPEILKSRIPRYGVRLFSWTTIPLTYL